MECRRLSWTCASDFICRAGILVIGPALLVCLPAPDGRAEEVIERWRNPFGHMRSASVNPTDSSCWVASGGSVLHLAPDGTILSQNGGLVTAMSVSVDPSDGSCWALGRSRVIRLAEDGTELVRLGVGDQQHQGSISVNPGDGSCWVTDTDNADHQLVHLASDGTEIWRGGPFRWPYLSVNTANGSCWAAVSWVEDDVWHEAVIHLAEDGTELLRVGDLRGRLSVNPTDGSCWVAAGDRVVHLAEDGTELLRVPRSAVDISVDPTDSSCWVVGGSEVTHLAEDGAELWRGSGFDFALHGSISVDPTDGSCWLIHVGGDTLDRDNAFGLALVHLSETGAQLWRRVAPFSEPDKISANYTDGSCWVSDPFFEQMVHLAADGTELWRGGGFHFPFSVSVNPADGSCWVGVDQAVAHLGADGTELWRGSGFTWPQSVSVNHTDGSCWVADNDPDEGHEVIHLAQNGTVLWRGTVLRPMSVSVNPVDGSCWVAHPYDDGVVHLAENGSELWWGADFLDEPWTVSVNPTDGSCWVGANPAVHLAEDGTELWRGEALGFLGYVSANLVDGSCWAVDVRAVPHQVIYLDEEGTELWRGDTCGRTAGGISVDPMDGSCWVADTDNGQVVRLEVVGYEGPHFPDIMPYHWAFHEVEACADSGIVGGYGDGLYHPDWTLSRDQMAVFISRSIATPTGPGSLEEYVPPTTPSFSDVPTGFWCYKYIEYAVEHDIVGGYGDGTYQPQVTIDRGQMAVFIARAMAGDDASVPDPTGSPSFPDVPADFWSYRHIEYIAEQEVAGGYYDGLYHPENLVSRDQMAVFICRAFELPT